MESSRQLFLVFVIALVGGYAFMLGRLMPFTPVDYGIAFAVGALALFLIRGIHIMMLAGDARLERTMAQVKAREGRNPDDAKTYEQKTEEKAMAYLRKVPLLRRLPILHLGNERRLEGRED